jgi:hypothetical protein
MRRDMKWPKIVVVFAITDAVKMAIKFKALK